MTETAAITRFYTSHAELYEVVCRDRDFVGQSAEIQQLSGRRTGARILELFAGPAYHSKILIEDYNDRVTCIDSSPAMRTVACRDGIIQPDDYHVGHLPAAVSLPARDTPFDGVLIMRYSIGYLEPRELESLLFNLRTLLEPGAFVFFELHRIDVVANAFQDLPIRRRISPWKDDLEVACTWPYGPLRWAPDDWRVEMTVRLELLSEERVLERQQFVSVEHIYPPNEIRRLASRLGSYVDTPQPLFSEFFPGASVLVLRAR